MRTCVLGGFGGRELNDYIYSNNYAVSFLNLIHPSSDSGAQSALKEENSLVMECGYTRPLPHPNTQCVQFIGHLFTLCLFQWVLTQHAFVVTVSERKHNKHVT